MNYSVQVTETALQHFQRLIEKEDSPGMNVRIYVANPGTPNADIGVTFCPKGEEEVDDIPIELKNFTLFVDALSQEALSGASIDFEDDELGGQLSIKAPKLRGKKPGPESTLFERIEYVLTTDINPGLAGHGGRVSLVELRNSTDSSDGQKIAVLRFGGGCHGCGMVGTTLQGGIERTLKEKFPEISEVVDITDHALGENPYY